MILALVFRVPVVLAVAVTVPTVSLMSASPDSNLMQPTWSM